jgi:hypothetical protein
MASLPERVAPESEQLAIIAQLEAENKEAGQRLARAQALAGIHLGSSFVC